MMKSTTNTNTKEIEFCSIIIHLAAAVPATILSIPFSGYPTISLRLPYPTVLPVTMPSSPTEYPAEKNANNEKLKYVQ